MLRDVLAAGCFATGVTVVVVVAWYKALFMQAMPVGLEKDSVREMGSHIYLRHPGDDEAVAVATGFSWGALLLGFIWALSKRMWFAAFVMLGVNLILFGIGFWGETADLVGFVLTIVFGVACGVYGNRWHRWTLERRGYQLM